MTSRGCKGCTLPSSSAQHARGTTASAWRWVLLLLLVVDTVAVAAVAAVLVAPWIAATAASPHESTSTGPPNRGCGCWCSTLSGCGCCCSASTGSGGSSQSSSLSNSCGSGGSSSSLPVRSCVSSCERNAPSRNSWNSACTHCTTAQHGTSTRVRVMACHRLAGPGTLQPQTTNQTGLCVRVHARARVVVCSLFFCVLLSRSTLHCAKGCYARAQASQNGAWRVQGGVGGA